MDQSYISKGEGSKPVAQMVDMKPVPQVEIDIRDYTKELAESSKRLEELTKKLNRRTDALVFLTILLAAFSLADYVARFFFHL